MSKRVSKYLPRLKLLSEASPRVRRAILADCDKETLHCICECAKNVLKGNLPVSEAQFQELHRHKKNLRELIKKKTSLTKKWRIVQTGGFIGEILAPGSECIGIFII